MKVLLITLCVLAAAAFADGNVLEFEADEFLDQSNPLVVPKLKLMKQCQEVREKCIKSGRRDCTFRYAICVAGSIVMCGKTCLMPYVMCIKDTRGTADEKAQYCIKEMITCLETHCEKTPATTTAATIDNSILEECKGLLDDCLNAASGIFQRGQCMIQFGICTAAKAVDCGKDCVAPMLMCKAKALGSFTLLIQCNIDFVKCIYASCTKPTTAVATVDNAVMEECQGLLHDCLDAADGFFEKGQCMVQFGICMAAHAVDCGKDCVPPMLMCKAKGLGSFTKLIHCNIEFVKCLYTSCTKPTTAAATIDNSILDECKGLLDDCLNAASGIFQRGQCVIQFGICTAAKAVDCGKDCVPPMLMCKAKGLGSFTKLIQCNIEFVKCLFTSCTKPATGVATVDNSIMDECKELLHNCLDAASGIFQKGQCMVQFGVCMTAHAVDCGKDCVAPMLLCKSKGLGSFTKLIHCNIEFVKCIASSCTKATTAAATIDNSILDECKGLLDDCLNAASGIFQKGQCMVQFGICTAAKAVDCGKDCVPPMLMCKAKGLGSFTKLIHCNIEFVKCLFTSCTKPTTEIATVDNSIIEECKRFVQQCLNAADGVIEKGQCMVQFGTCMAAKAVDCGQECVPPMRTCKSQALGSFTKLIHCNIAYVKCLASSCTNHESSMAVASGSNGIVKSIGDVCNNLYEFCHKWAILPIARLVCFNLHITCKGITGVGCANDCIPAFIKCKIWSIGRIMATIQCYKDFLSCATTCKPETTADPVTKLPPSPPPSSPIQSELETTSVAVKNDVIRTIADVCNMLHGECTKLAWTPIQKLICFNLHVGCMGIQGVGCATDCIPAFLKCHLWSIGRLFATIKCYKEFIKCTIGGCKNGTDIAPSNMVSLPLNDEMSPYEFAIQAVDDNSVSFTECKKEFFICIKTGEGIKGKLQCFTKLGKCIGGELIGCSSHCIPQSSLCVYEAKGSWIKTALCAVEFLLCAKDGCIGE